MASILLWGRGRISLYEGASPRELQALDQFRVGVKADSSTAGELEEGYIEGAACAELSRAAEALHAALHGARAQLEAERASVEERASV